MRELVLIEDTGASRDGAPVKKKARVLFVVSALFSLAFGPLSMAEANTLVSTSPSSGAVLAVAPNAVSVTGSTALSDQGSSLSVMDPTGKQVDDGSLTINDTTAVIGLKPLTAPGVYTVSYNLVSSSDIPLVGSFTFLFNAPAAISSPTPTPATTVTAQVPTKINHTVDIFVILLMVFAVFVGLFLIWYARLLLRERAESKKRKRSRSSRTPAKKRTNSDEE
jgi:methionine-rich copper-binding protein CopC